MFDTEKKSESLDQSTFDIVQVDSFHNTRFWTLMSYLWVWVLVLLTVAILALDTYTCVSILVFHRWSSSEYDVYEYKIAKWIFTGCILFRFVLLVYQISWGIHIYRTRNIALAYLNNYSRLFYAVRSYNYQCLFHEIDHEGFFQWACFFIYFEMDDALQILVADLPRQVINFMTLRYYATGGEMNNDILANIRALADTNLRLSIILSVQLLSIAIFLFFFLSFLVAVLLYIPIKVKVSSKGFRSLKAYCYKAVNDKVRFLVRRNHKPKKQILEEGLMNYSDIQANPLLGSSTTFDLRTDFALEHPNPFSSNPLDRYDTSVNPFESPFENPYPKSKFAHSDSNISLSDLTPGEAENPFERSSRNKFMSNAGNDTPTDSEFPNKNATYPRRYTPIAPPPRTQTTDSLTSHREMNSHIYNEDVNKPFKRGRLDVHLADSRSDTSTDLLNLSRKELMSLESLDFAQGKKVESLDSVPYPVRGVSTFMDDEVLTEWSHSDTNYDQRR